LPRGKEKVHGAERNEPSRRQFHCFAVAVEQPVGHHSSQICVIFFAWQGAASDAYRCGFKGAGGGFAEVGIRPDRSRDDSLCSLPKSGARTSEAFWNRHLGPFEFLRRLFVDGLHGTCIHGIQRGAYQRRSSRP